VAPSMRASRFRSTGREGEAEALGDAVRDGLEWLDEGVVMFAGGVTCELGLALAEPFIGVAEGLMAWFDEAPTRARVSSCDGLRFPWGGCASTRKNGKRSHSRSSLAGAIQGARTDPTLSQRVVELKRVQRTTDDPRRGHKQEHKRVTFTGDTKGTKRHCPTCY
jgi:hypothetical protein